MKTTEHRHAGWNNSFMWKIYSLIKTINSKSDRIRCKLKVIGSRRTRCWRGTKLLRKPGDKRDGTHQEFVLNYTDAAMMMSGKARAGTGKSGRSRWHSARLRISHSPDASLTRKHSSIRHGLLARKAFEALTTEYKNAMSSSSSMHRYTDWLHYGYGHK